MFEEGESASGGNASDLGALPNPNIGLVQPDRRKKKKKKNLEELQLQSLVALDDLDEALIKITKADADLILSRAAKPLKRLREIIAVGRRSRDTQFVADGINSLMKILKPIKISSTELKSPGLKEANRANPVEIEFNLLADPQQFGYSPNKNKIVVGLRAPVLTSFARSLSSYDHPTGRPSSPPNKNKPGSAYKRSKIRTSGGSVTKQRYREIETLLSDRVLRAELVGVLVEWANSAMHGGYLRKAAARSHSDLSYQMAGGKGKAVGMGGDKINAAVHIMRHYQKEVGRGKTQSMTLEQIIQANPPLAVMRKAHGDAWVSKVYRRALREPELVFAKQPDSWLP